MGLVRLGRAGICLVLLLAVGCKDKASAKPDPKVTEAAEKAEQDLLARRDALLQSREKLEEEKSKLQAKIDETRKAGGDTTELETELAKLSSEADANQDALVELLRKQNESYKAELEALRVSGGGGGDKTEIAALSAQLQRRDGQLADMEKRLVTMAGQLGAIRDDIQKQAETCGAGGGTTTIIQAGKLPSGSRYSKRDVEPILTKVRGIMSKRGISSSDLPGGIAGLEKEATGAMADGEYSKAFLAATTLLQNVDAIKIDKGFVSQKIARLNRVMKAKKLDDATGKQVLDLFNEVGEKYNDGDFTGANRRLNAIANLL
jgi:DNA repair exonuclease SbcCD ATPase subunit